MLYKLKVTGQDVCDANGVIYSEQEAVRFFGQYKEVVKDFPEELGFNDVFEEFREWFVETNPDFPANVEFEIEPL